MKTLMNRVTNDLLSHPNIKTLSLCNHGESVSHSFVVNENYFKTQAAVLSETRQHIKLSLACFNDLKAYTYTAKY